MISFKEYITEGKTSFWPKGLNFMFKKNLGSFDKKIKDRNYKFTKIKAEPKEVIVELQFSFEQGDEKATYNENSFAYVRAIIDGEKKTFGFDHNDDSLKTPESLKFSKTNNELNGKIAEDFGVTKASLEVTINKTGDHYVAKITEKLI